MKDEWVSIGRAIGVAEDHHGFYDAQSEALITARIDDMLAEACPRECTVTEASGEDYRSGVESPVQLLNEAWRRYRESPADYSEWEMAAVRKFLGESTA